MKSFRFLSLPLCAIAVMLLAPQNQPAVAQAAPKGDKTAEGMKYPFKSSQAEGKILLSRESGYLRVDVETALPYDVGDGLDYGGSGVEVMLSVDGLSGRRMIAFPARIWQPGGTMPVFRYEGSYQKGSPAVREPNPSYACTANVKAYDRFTTTFWIDLKKCIMPGSTAEKVSETFRLGVVSGTTVETIKFPEGIDVADPTTKPDAMLTFKVADLPERPKPRADPLNAWLLRETNFIADCKRVFASLRKSEWRGAFDILKDMSASYPEQMAPRYCTWAFSNDQRFKQYIKEDPLPYLKDYYEACPSRLQVLNEYLNSLISNNRDKEAFELYDKVVATPLGTIGVRRAEMDANWCTTLIDNGYGAKAEPLIAPLLENPDVKKSDILRVVVKTLRAKLCEAKGDSKGAAAAYDSILTEEKAALFPTIDGKEQKSLRAEFCETMRDMHNAAAKQWDEEQTFRTEDAKLKQPRITLETSKGKVVIELFQDDAPNTVFSMVKLTQKKFYDNLTFHRYVPGFMVQGGDPKGDGSGGPGYRLKSEVGPNSANRRNFFRGVVGMACLRPGTDTEGSQFFICTHNTSSVLGASGKYVPVGRVIEGMEIVDMLRQSDKIKVATVGNLRDNTKYEPETKTP